MSLLLAGEHSREVPAQPYPTTHSRASGKPEVGAHPHPPYTPFPRKRETRSWQDSSMPSPCNPFPRKQETRSWCTSSPTLQPIPAQAGNQNLAGFLNALSLQPIPAQAGIQNFKFSQGIEGVGVTLKIN